ncbi:hypothetical protein [Psychromicrobium xiongbiense]|uniref:hypothetical protein n=1 Tax=Psychromicrobium xiongbiense TaxID=3051184 RepID=UPI0025525559|nr:hypothetical protein [Psychromicrobium sp. YIM S02556]
MYATAFVGMATDHCAPSSCSHSGVSWAGPLGAYGPWVVMALVVVGMLMQGARGKMVALAPMCGLGALFILFMVVSAGVSAP